MRGSMCYPALAERLNMYKMTDNIELTDIKNLPDSVFTAQCSELYDIYMEYKVDEICSFTLFTAWIKAQKEGMTK